jgi:hypothetical protein
VKVCAHIPVGAPRSISVGYIIGHVGCTSFQSPFNLNRTLTTRHLQQIPLFYIISPQSSQQPRPPNALAQRYPTDPTPPPDTEPVADAMYSAAPLHLRTLLNLLISL